MAYSYAQTVGDGSTTVFTVPCDYISRSHISVTVNSVAVAFSWVDTYRVQTATTPAAGSVVEVRRTTPRNQIAVTFTDGSTLVQSDLNVNALQSFYLAQEAFDQGDASLIVAAASKTIAEAAQSGVNSIRAYAETKAAEAANSAAAAAQSAANAKIWDAANYYTIADVDWRLVQKQDNIGFTPIQQGGGDSMGNNKVNIGWRQDATLGLKVDSTDFGATWPLNITGQANSVGGWDRAHIESLITDRISRYGDTLSGDLEIVKSDPCLWLHYPNAKRGRWVVASNGEVCWQDQGGQIHLSINTSGAIWTQSYGYLTDRFAPGPGITEANVGTFIFAVYVGNALGLGNYVAGSEIYAAAMNQNTSSTITYSSGSALPGTWRCLGHSPYNPENQRIITLFQRVA